MKQPDLFPPPAKHPPRVATPPFSDWMPFDNWDLSRMVPDPDYVPPEELRLWIDDDATGSVSNGAG